MAVIEILIAEFFQYGKHFAVFHIVSVNNCIGVGKITGVAIVHKDAAGTVGGAVIGFMQIGIIVLSAVYQRVIYHSVINPNPAFYFAIDCLQAVKVDEKSGPGHRFV